MLESVGLPSDCNGATRREHILPIRVLIADDDPEFVSTVIQTMGTKRYAVSSANNRLQAREMIENEEMDCVIIGTMMPLGDAFKLHQWLREDARLSGLPIIVVDASSEKQFINGWWQHEGLSLEPDEYMSRPVDPMALMSRIDKLMDKGIEKIRVLVADDQAVVRDGICAVVDQQKDMHVVGDVGDGREAVVKTLELLPDVVLMDVVMPEMDGLEATRQICQQWGGARVLIISQYDDQETIRMSIESGAVGFIPKRNASSDLIEGIRHVSQGKQFGGINSQGGRYILGSDC